MGSGTSRLPAKDLEIKLSTVRNEKSALQTQVADAQARLKALQSRLEAAEGSASAGEKEKAELLERLKAAEESAASAEQGKADLQDRLKTAEADLAKRGEASTEAEGVLSDLRTRLKSAEKSAAAAEKEKARLEALTSTVDKDREDLQGRLTASEESAATAKQEQVDLQAQLTALQSRLEAAEISAADAEADLAKRKEASSDAEGVLSDLRARLKSAEESAATADKEKAELEAQLKAAYLEVDKCRDTSVAAQTTISDLQRQLETAESRSGKAAGDVHETTCETDLQHPTSTQSAGTFQETKLDEINQRCSNKFFKNIWDSVDPKAPMIVLNLAAFKAFGKVPCSDQVQPQEFLSLPAVAKVVFVSHRWLRPNEDAKLAHPDDEDGSKHALLGKGIEVLAEKKGWMLEHVYLWMDFFSIEQFETDKKMAGINSLRGYASACDAMIVPCAKTPGAFRDVDQLPGGYGERAWTRLEAMTFYTISILSEFGHQEIHAVADARPLFMEVYKYDLSDTYLPSKGELFSDADRPVILNHETKMLQFLKDSWADPEMCFRFIASNMVKGRKLTSDDAPQLLAAANRGMELGLQIACSELDFRANEIGAEGAKALAVALRPQKISRGFWKYNGALKSLYLDENKIGDEGAKALAAALEPHQNPDKTWVFNGALNTLYLSGNEIGAEGAKALAAALEPRQNPDNTWVFNAALGNLNLEENQIGAEGAKALATALEPRQNLNKTWAFNGVLATLWLADNKIGDEGAKALASALEPKENPDGTWSYNGALEVLDLSHNSVSVTAAFDEILFGLDENVISANVISEDVKTILREVVEKVNAHRKGENILEIHL